jgi:hypothetical protein
MKKVIIIITILLLCLINSTCLANYFEDNSDRFISYDSTKQYKAYVDLESINVVRNDPPNYVIQAESYIFDSVNHLGMKYVEQYFYNYKTKNIDAELNKFAKCDENGNISKEFKFEDKKSTHLTLTHTSPGYNAAKIAFAKAYNMPFVTENDSSKHN